MSLQNLANKFPYGNSVSYSTETVDTAYYQSNHAKCLTGYVLYFVGSENYFHDSHCFRSLTLINGENGQ